MTLSMPKTEYLSTKLRTNMHGVRIEATGLGMPQRLVLNDDLASLGCDSEWIVQRTGILSRYHASADQATSDLAYLAGRNCLEQAGCDPAEVDLIMVATMTPDHYTPSSSCLVQAKLGAKCPAFDLNAACSGFMYGMIVGSQFLKSGCCRKILLICADKMTCVIDPQDVKTFPLFGDGAAAALLTEDTRDEDVASGILAYKLGSVGEMGGTLVVPGCGSRLPASHAVLEQRDQFLKMDGRSVFKWAVRLVPDVVNELLTQANMTLDELDLLVFHQANRRILDAVTEALVADPDRVFVNVDRYGNTSAASIPISLHEAAEQGRIRRGSRVLLAGFGAGLTWGGCIIRW